MTELRPIIQDYLDTNGVSMRALSLQAGLNPKAVSDILSIPGLRPTRTTLDALGGVMGADLPDGAESVTYARLIASLSVTTGDIRADQRNARRVSRLRLVLRQAGWVPETDVADRNRMIALFARWSPATLGLTARSFQTYKSDVLSAIDMAGGSSRKSGIRDVVGLYAEVHDLLAASGFPRDLALVSGAFFYFLDQQGIKPSQITPTVLEAYYHHRLGDTTKTPAICRKHVKRVAHLCTRVAEHPDFERFGFVPVSHPFENGTDRYGVSVEVLAPLLDEFDGPVTSWLRGQFSCRGEAFAAFIARLDAEAPQQRPADDKKLLLRTKVRKGAATAEQRRSAGFLSPSQTWSEATIANRRGMIIAGAKALHAAAEYRIETIEELTDPDVVEAMLDALAAANSGKPYPSSYIETFGKALKKLAREYVGRTEKEIEDIRDIVAAHSSGAAGIAARNKAKLRQLVGEREQRLIDLGDIVTEEINARLDRLARRQSGRPRWTLLDIEDARDVMSTIASDIMLARAPRSDNVIGIKLSWISWEGGLARITVPNVEVKGRLASDPDLPIPLDPQASRRLRIYLDKVRAKALMAGDDKNPFLFPAQGGERDKPYGGLLGRLMRHAHRIVGVAVNPHLYRHFVGWHWLKADPDRLPDVQRLLGHKSVQTTLAYYAEIDEALALGRWQQHLSRKTHSKQGGRWHAE